MDIFRLIAEERIREAESRGEFDDLPGKGKPLPPDELEGVPEELRVSYRLLKNAGVLPEEMQLRKDMLTLGDLIAACKSDSDRQGLERELSAKKLRYQTLMAERGWSSTGVFAEYEGKIQAKLTSTSEK
ncbi:DnaJ family domain-containing protein [Paenibacillus sp. CAU 1782]